MSTLHRSDYPSKPQQPLLISAANCEEVLGLRWRVVRKHAARMGLPIYTIGRKLVIDAELLMESLGRSQHAAPRAIEDLPDTEQQRMMREALGLQAEGHR